MWSTAARQSGPPYQRWRPLGSLKPWYPLMAQPRTIWCSYLQLLKGSGGRHVKLARDLQHPRARVRTAAEGSPSSPPWYWAACVVILALWHAAHSRHHSLMSAANPGQMKRLCKSVTFTSYINCLKMPSGFLFFTFPLDLFMAYMSKRDFFTIAINL